jgi:hypothetical protein
VPAYNQGQVGQQQTYQSVPNDVFGIAIHWFANRNPLAFRLPKQAEGASAFQMVGYKYRPRTTTLGAALTDGTGTTVTVADASFFMAGDVIKVNSEYMEVTVDPPSGTTLTVRRGASGSTGATALINAVVTLVGNSRTGGEKNPTAVTPALASVTQFMQVIQHPYSVAGSVQANTFFPNLPGASTPLASYKMVAMQNAIDDMEYSAYQGKAEGISGSVSRQKMGGLRNLLTTNVQTSPSDASAYKAASFQRDLLTSARKKGGQPSAIYVSSNFMDAFQIWGLPAQRIMAGTTIFGTPISVFASPFLGGIDIVECSLLPDFTAFALTESEAKWRVRRPLADTPYGVTGDSSDGHMLAELALEVDNEPHHSWVEGVTAFSA